LPEGVQRVAAALKAKNHPHAPVMLDDAARTAQQAADALGIALGQIAKSIIFRRKADDVAVLVITSGDRRVDEKKVEALVGRIGPRRCRFRQGQDRLQHRWCVAAGACKPPVTLVDRNCFASRKSGPRRGIPHGVFKLHPHDLAALAGAPTADVTQAVQVMTASMNAIDNTSGRAVLARATGQNVPSPCVSVCRMDAKAGSVKAACAAIDEIRLWSTASDREKKAVWALIAQRITVQFP
jgi:prolyl-tRNA editing enzyme YbaK/EbsC (Cys-tRNA(Pro) deacylase)/predicted Fe-S protein YdhL (DUF1289 family)